MDIEVLRILQASRKDHATKPLEEDIGRRDQARSPLTLIVLYLAITPGLDLKDIAKPCPSTISEWCRRLAMQLTARCVGFLEISTYRNLTQEEPRSGVVFLHRTARDFIEGGKQWSQIVSVDSDSDFDPTSALTIGSALCVVLEWRLYGSGHQHRVTTHMHHIAADALINAQHNSLCYKPPIPRIFEEMGKAVSWDEVGRERWSSELEAGTHSTRSRTYTFLELAVKYGYVPYVLHRMGHLSQVELDGLLNLLLESDVKTKQAPSSDIVAILLHYGAVHSRSVRNFNSFDHVSAESSRKKRSFQEFEYESEDSESDDDSDTDESTEDALTGVPNSHSPAEAHEIGRLVTMEEKRLPKRRRTH